MYGKNEVQYQILDKIEMRGEEGGGSGELGNDQKNCNLNGPLSLLRDGVIVWIFKDFNICRSSIIVVCVIID